MIIVNSLTAENRINGTTIIPVISERRYADIEVHRSAKSKGPLTAAVPPPVLHIRMRKPAQQPKSGTGKYGRLEFTISSPPTDVSFVVASALVLSKSRNG
jgi:hypothetical protein